MSVATGKNDFEAGLAFEIDASNPRSYSGSGTSIYDLSGNNVTGTLTNGPTYSSLHGGTITFDGTNDYISMPSSSNLLSFGTADFSISFWIYVNSTSSQTIFTNYNAYNSGYTNYFFIGYYNSLAGIYILDSSGNTTYPTAVGSSVAQNTWAQITFTRTGTTYSCFKNGAFVNSQSDTDVSYTGTGRTILLGGGLADFGYFNGQIANLSVYSRALGASEVSQMFDSTKGQFVTAPTTNGLILYLDAGNTSSYSGSGTAWTDISGYGNNGTLTNGPTYSALNGGYFTFDRVDDYCIVPFSTILNNCTISVWFKATSTASYQYLLSLGNGSNTSFAFHFDMNDPDLGATGQTMWVYWNSGGTPYSVLSRSGTYGDYNDNTWRNYCFVRNNSDASVTKHYMNGAERTTGVTRAGTQTTQFGNGAGYNINIGRFHTGGGSFFAGNVAIFQVYNRVLTDTEISQNFNAFRERFNI